MKKRLIGILLAAALAASLSPAYALEYQPAEDEPAAASWETSKSKKASPAELGPDESKTKVTLSLPSAEITEPDKARVVLVMDKSSVEDIGPEQFNSAASNFIDQLAEKGETDDVMLDVITFNWNVVEQTNGFETLNKNSAAGLKSKIADMGGGGTDLYGALEYARWRLENTSDPALENVDASQKYLVLISDLGGYLFCSPADLASTDAAAVLKGINDTRAYRNLPGAANNFDWDGKSTVTNADGQLVYGNLTHSPINIAPISAEQIDGLIRNKVLISGETADDQWIDRSNPTRLPQTRATLSEPGYVNSYEANVYFNGNDLLDMKNAGINIVSVTRDYHSGRNESVLEGAFADWLANVGPHYDLSGGATIKEAFEGITSRIIYLMGSGTVTDRIGGAFDVASVAGECPFALSVEGTALAASPIGDNEWGFGTKDETTGKYPYSVLYTPGADEQFVWTINVPVEKARPVEFSYDLTLTAVPDETTKYAANESAVLKYVSSDGKYSGEETFEVPEVSVSVAKHTLTYETNGGEPIAPETYKSRTVVRLSKTPVRGGFEFAGWYSDKALTVPAASVTMDADRTVYAKWNVSGGGGVTTMYTLTFDTNGGTAVASVTREAGTVIPLAQTTSRGGFTFGGWYSDKALTKAVSSVTLNSDMTVYAGWTASGKPEMFRDDHTAYIIGYEDDTVRPSAAITRAEAATIFFRLLSDEVRAQNLATENTFSDVGSGAWYNTAVSTLENMGIVNGRGGKFDGGAAITRAEFAAIAARFDSAAYSGTDRFSDISGHWAEALINRAADKGWVVGFSDGTFLPDRNITRAEAMTLINRVLVRQPETASDLLAGMVTWPDNGSSGAWYYLAVQEATNSHDCAVKSDGVHEKWTALTAVPDWSRYER